MVASLLETILITDLLHSSTRLSPVPRWLRVLVLQVFGCIVCLPWKPTKENNTDVPLTSVGQAVRPPNARVAMTVAPGGKGELSEDMALQQLRSLGEDVQALRLHVDQQMGESPTSQEWVQVGFVIDRLLFGLYILFISVSFVTIIIIWCQQQNIKCSRVLFSIIILFLCVNGEAVMLNCSSPDPPALLSALTPVFQLSSIRPVANLSTPTNVTVEFIMFGILGVVWQNEFVKWDPEQCGSSRITIPRKKLWVPDIVMNEFMEENTAPSVPYVYLYSDGTVVDDQPVKVVSSCRLDIYLFPFDTQNCSFSFNSYILMTSDLDINSMWEDDLRFNVSKDVMTTMGEWNLVGLSVRKLELPSGDGTTYFELRYQVVVQRSPTMYVVNLLLPSCLLIGVDLFSFLLPPQSVDRSQFKVTLILGYTMFLLIMNNLLPVTGDTIPLMNVFLCMCLVLMVGSLLETIIITNLLCGLAKDCPVPWILRLIILKFLGPLVFLPPKAKKKESTIIENPAVHGAVALGSSAEQAPPSRTVEALQCVGREVHLIRQQVEQQRSSSEVSEEWFQMGYITDRVIFVTYVIFISVSFITIVTMWSRSP
uniref:Uncharacterized protein n=1 Tax=Knipowitschia caucasica TaxID=637954 RepID=A0AAV2KTY1_KNICA